MLANISKIEYKDKMIVRVIRPSKNRIKDENPHISEIEYTNIPYDIIMINNGSIDEYISRFEKLMNI
jgi:hypothetical protein